MFVLSIAAWAAALVGGIVLLRSVDAKIVRATGYKVFTASKLAILLGASICFYFGRGLAYEWREWHSHDDGWALLAIGVIAVCGLCALNLRSAGWMYGLIATALHLAIFCVGVQLGILLVPLLMLGLSANSAKPVYVVNQ